MIGAEQGAQRVNSLVDWIRVDADEQSIDSVIPASTSATSPAIARSSVVLPAPLGPTSTTSSPAST